MGAAQAAEGCGGLRVFGDGPAQVGVQGIEDGDPGQDGDVGVSSETR
jgi:hypothetical protein